MEPEALARVAQWGAIGAWGLLPQAVIAVSLAALAARGGMKAAVLAYGLALALLLSYASLGWQRRSTADGLAQLPARLPSRSPYSAALGSQCPLLVALAVDGDLALVPAGIGGCRGAGLADLPGPVERAWRLQLRRVLLVVAATWLGSADLRACPGAIIQSVLMIELIQITNDPAFARRCDALAGFRLFVDLERLGKAERQAGRNTFISAHSLEDVGRIKRGVAALPADGPRKSAERWHAGGSRGGAWRAAPTS